MRALWVLVPLVVLAGCGYSFKQRTAKDIKSIAVPFFSNATTEPNIELQVTEQIINNLIEDNTLRVVDEEEADAVLDGRITEFTNLPFSFNEELDAEEYHVVVTVNVSLFNRRENLPVWENKIIKGDGSYFLDVPDFTFDGALEEAITEITDRIINLTVGDW